MGDAFFNADNLREDIDLEAKRAAGRDGKGALPQAAFETYSAFANTDGGVILLGVSEDKDGKLQVTGVEEADRVITELWTEFNNPQKVRRMLSENLVLSSADSEASSAHIGPNSAHLSGSSAHLRDSSAHLPAAADDPSADPSLREIAKPVSSTGKTGGGTMRQTILALCRERYLSVQQLAALLKRAPDRLRERFIKPMVEEKLLERRYPQQPNHERQAYRTQESSFE